MGKTGFLCGTEASRLSVGDLGSPGPFYNCVNCIPRSPSPLARTNHLVSLIPRCLMTPLGSLSITHYQISQSDLDSFSCCQSLFQLKHLEMKGMVLQVLDVMPLRGLLEKVVKTLETLNLQGCKLKDSQLNALLPSFIQCSQLTKVNFYNNDFSMPILKDLLQHTANWNKMNVEQYPAPLECYNELGHVSVERFAQLCQELMDTLRAIRQPKSLSFATRICHKCGEPCVYGQGGRLCFCWRWTWIQNFCMWINDSLETHLSSGVLRDWLQAMYRYLERKGCTIIGILEAKLDMGSRLVDWQRQLGCFEWTLLGQIN